MSCENLTELGLHEPSMFVDVQNFREHGYRAPYARTKTRPDVLIVEHINEPCPEHVRPGDLLIRLERAA